MRYCLNILLDFHWKEVRRFSWRTALGAEWSGWVDLGWVDVRLSDGPWQCHLFERSHIHTGYINFVKDLSGWMDLGWVDVRPQVTDISDGLWQCVSSDYLSERSHIHTGFVTDLLLGGWILVGLT